MKTTIKAIELTRKIREKQHEDIKDKSYSEIIEYFRSRAQKINADTKVLISK